MPKLSFLGAAGTVTGSKYLLELDGTRVLVDCGMYQGFKKLRERNWQQFPVEPSTIDAIVLTHAHIDHSGYIPALVKNGFSGDIFCTDATHELCKILLRDSGYLNEREADLANKYGYSKHKVAKPLYTTKDAEKSLLHFRSVGFDKTMQLNSEIDVRFVPAGHILGAASVILDAGGKTIVFSGDLGQYDAATMVNPTRILHADYLLVESTYGNRLHEKQDPETALADVINRTAKRGGSVIIPSFAVGRSQTIMYHLQRLKSADRIPDLPVYLDSPMAVNASKIFCKYLDIHRLSAAECDATCDAVRYVNSVEESKSLDSNVMPKVIISASGMATGGRVLHHIKHYATDARNTILFAGFQAAGTRGAAMCDGAKSVKIHGQDVPINAEVVNLHMMSAHADADQIMRWLNGFSSVPRKTFIVHGEPTASQALQQKIETELGWDCVLPNYLETVELT